MPSYHRTQIVKIDRQPIFSDINASSASVWDECLYQMEMYQWGRGYGHAHYDFYIGDDCEGWIDKRLSKKQHLHSQSIQAVRECYFKSWKSYTALKRIGGIKDPKPPNKSKSYMTTTWKKSAIKFIDTVSGKHISLSIGVKRDRLVIRLPKKFDMSKSHLVATVELFYNYGKWELHFSYRYETKKTETGKGIIGVDIGEIHPMVTHDGEDTRIYNGRYIRSLYRHRNKVMSEFSSAISRCKYHSKRWWKLTRRKWKRINTIDNQIKDALHQHTAKFIKYCAVKGIGIIVLGDLTGIRQNIDYGKRANQKLHQWAFGKITYKAKALGIKVVQIDESYTSQTCPACGKRHKPTNRNYRCKCGFKFHRDGVGAINIRKKYQGNFGVPVVADTDNQAVNMTQSLGLQLQVPVASS